MTFDQRPGFCTVCRKDTCDCPYCHGARHVRFKGQLIRCDVCFPKPDPEEQPEPVKPPSVRPSRRTYQERLES